MRATSHRNESQIFSSLKNTEDTQFGLQMFCRRQNVPSRRNYFDFKLVHTTNNSLNPNNRLSIPSDFPEQIQR
jgi:hypothetical protein